LTTLGLLTVVIGGLAARSCVARDELRRDVTRAGRLYPSSTLLLRSADGQFKVAVEVEHDGVPGEPESGDVAIGERRVEWSYRRDEAPPVFSTFMRVYGERRVDVEGFEFAATHRAVPRGWSLDSRVSYGWLLGPLGVAWVLLM